MEVAISKFIGNWYLVSRIQIRPDLQLINNPYYNLRYNPSAPFVRSGFIVSYRIRSAMKTTAPRTAPHLTYIQGIGIPNKASFEILAMNTGLN